jgi:hypothetical protein
MMNIQADSNVPTSAERPTFPGALGIKPIRRHLIVRQADWTPITAPEQPIWPGFGPLITGWSGNHHPARPPASDISGKPLPEDIH